MASSARYVRNRLTAEPVPTPIQIAVGFLYRRPVWKCIARRWMDYRTLVRFHWNAARTAGTSFLTGQNSGAGVRRWACASRGAVPGWNSRLMTRKFSCVFLSPLCSVYCFAARCHAGTWMVTSRNDISLLKRTVPLLPLACKNTFYLLVGAFSLYDSRITYFECKLTPVLSQVWLP
jgi:hypothetical protein